MTYELKLDEKLNENRQRQIAEAQAQVVTSPTPFKTLSPSIIFLLVVMVVANESMAVENPPETGMNLMVC